MVADGCAGNAAARSRRADTRVFVRRFPTWLEDLERRRARIATAERVQTTCATCEWPRRGDVFNQPAPFLQLLWRIGPRGAGKLRILTQDDSRCHRSPFLSIQRCFVFRLT